MNIALICHCQFLQAFLRSDVPPDQEDRRHAAVLEFRNVTHFMNPRPIRRGKG